jgi:6,7-dimethyl-8-ribityllumazine synthase
MTGSEMIEKWIEEMRNRGMKDEDMYGTMFVKGDAVYELKKSKRKGKFDLRCTIGKVINLDTYKFE